MNDEQEYEVDNDETVDVIDNDGQLVAHMTVDHNETGDWIVLITHTSDWKARTDVLPYAAETWTALCHVLDQLRETVWQ